MVEMVIEGNEFQSHRLDTGFPQGSPVSLILISIQTAELIKWVEQTFHTEGLSFVDGHGWVASGKDLNQVVENLEAGAAPSIEWASRRDLLFDTAKTDAELFTPRRGQKKHPGVELTSKIMVGNAFVRFNNEATQSLGVWMDTHLTFKEHHNQCMKNARDAEAPMHTHTGIHGIVPERE
jgi:hypothetical protein